MYCVIQFYVQLRTPLAEHSPFLKVLAIKLVIFLSFWQSMAISVGTSTLHIVHANDVIAYPDIKVGIPSLLLCVEMACFAVLHLWAFPYRPYLDNARTTFYPVADPDGLDAMPKPNEHYPRSGGFMGLGAIVDALNIWDVVKAFGRGVRWLCVGVRKRHNDISYQASLKNSEMDLDDLSPQKFKRNNGATSVMMGDDVDTGYHSNLAGQSTEHLPIATQFRRSRFDTLSSVAEGDAGDLSNRGGMSPNTAADGGVGPGGPGMGGVGAIAGGAGGAGGRRLRNDESAGLIAYAQPMSTVGFNENYDSSPERDRDGAAPGRSGVYRDDDPYAAPPGRPVNPYADGAAGAYSPSERSRSRGRPQQMPPPSQAQRPPQPPYGM